MVKSLLPPSETEAFHVTAERGIVDPRTLPPEYRVAQRMVNIQIRVGTGSQTPENFERASAVEMIEFPDAGIGMFVPDLPVALQQRGKS